MLFTHFVACLLAGNAGLLTTGLVVYQVHKVVSTASDIDKIPINLSFSEISPIIKNNNADNFESMSDEGISSEDNSINDNVEDLNSVQEISINSDIKTTKLNNSSKNIQTKITELTKKTQKLKQLQEKKKKEEEKKSKQKKVKPRTKREELEEMTKNQLEALGAMTTGDCAADDPEEEN